MKYLLNEKEKSCQKLEIEMVDLKRKVEGNNNANDRLKNRSIILDEILDKKRSPFDKIGLGYKKEAEQSGVRTWILKKPEANTSSSRMEANSSSSKPERKIGLGIFTEHIRHQTKRTSRN